MSIQAVHRLRRTLSRDCGYHIGRTSARAGICCPLSRSVIIAHNHEPVPFSSGGLRDSPSVLSTTTAASSIDWTERRARRCDWIEVSHSVASRGHLGLAGNANCCSDDQAPGRCTERTPCDLTNTSYPIFSTALSGPSTEACWALERGSLEECGQAWTRSARHHRCCVVASIA